MSTATLVPYGLRHRVRLPDGYTTPLSGVAYDPELQLNDNGMVTAERADLAALPDELGAISLFQTVIPAPTSASPWSEAGRSPS